MRKPRRARELRDIPLMQSVLLYRAWRVHSLLFVTGKVVVVSMRYGFLAAKLQRKPLFSPLSIDT